MTSPVTETTMTDIAVDGLWAAGPAVNPSVVDTATALLASVRGDADPALPADLATLTATVRGAATVSQPWVIAMDGVRLSALAIRLKGSGPRPVVIVPAGWNPYGWLPSVFACLTLAARGFHVVAYTPRGIGDRSLSFASHGTVDLAGPLDRSDGAVVLDHVQELVGPSTIGFLGSSYGATLGQLIAAHDPAARVAAVVALSPWGNLATDLYRNGTRRTATVPALIALTGGTEQEKFDAATRQLLADHQAGRNLDEVQAWAAERAPVSYVDETNSRGVATLMSHTWHDGLFPPASVIDAFERLTTPKRLSMWIGGHGAPEAAGLAGLTAASAFPGLGEPLREACDWLDHHLRGTGNGVPSWSPLSNQVMFTAATDGRQRITEAARREGRPGRRDVVTGVQTWNLGGGQGRDGTLTEASAPGWSRGFAAGDLTEAAAMESVLRTGVREWTGTPRIYHLEKFDRAKLLVWLTAPQPTTRIRGAAQLRLTVRSSAGAATLVAYLFDVGPDDGARIITHEAFTAEGLTPGADRAAGWALQPTAYDLPDGHRLALVVNSRDALYAFTGTPGSTTTISAPSQVEIPLG